MSRASDNNAKSNPRETGRNFESPPLPFWEYNGVMPNEGLLFLLVLLSIFTGPARAANFYRVNAGQSVWIFEHSVGRLVQNTGTKDVFVPTRTSGEWSTFIANKPAYILLTACPPNYVGVPPDGTNTTTLFCVMAYEAKDVGGVATSQAALTPWVNINNANARAACQAISAKHDIMTNAQYQAIAQNLEFVAANWSSGTVGSGCLKQGNLGTAFSGCSYFTGSAQFGGSRNSLDRMTLSTGEFIWDFNGNVHERIIPMTDPMGAGGLIIVPAHEATGTPKNLWGPKNNYSAGCGTDSSTTCGMGYMHYRQAPNVVSIRGGAYDNEWGIFSMHSGYADLVDPSAGFRCIFNP